MTPKTISRERTRAERTAAALLATLATFALGGCTSTSSGGASAACDAGQVTCGNTCVITADDPANCGGCGQACTGGEVCSAGQCALTCVGGSTLCNAACVTTANDPANCGGCGQACTGGEVCSAGRCALTCVGGSTLCAGACVTTADDPANCGGCGQACTGGEVCSAGQCALICVGGSTLCDGACVSTAEDLANCGGCGQACVAPAGALAQCAAGACAFACNAGFADCDLVASNGCEVDVLTSAAHCGACGVACAGGQTCQAGACVSGLLCVVDDNSSDLEVFAETGGAALRTIVGGDTQIGNPIGVAADLVNGEVWVSSQSQNLTAFALSADGDAIPLRNIVGIDTGIMSPLRGVAVDPATNEVFALGSNPGTVTVYDRTASGDAAPLRSFGALQSAGGMALDAVHHEVYVVSQKSGSQNGLITVWDEAATAASAPLRSIEITANGPFGDALSGVAVDAVNDEIYVTNSADFSNPGLFVYARTASGLDPAPLRSIISDQLRQANQIAVDLTTGVVAVTAYSSGVGGAIFVYPRTWTGTTVPPLVTVGGLAGTWGVAICR